MVIRWFALASISHWWGEWSDNIKTPLNLYLWWFSRCQFFLPTTNLQIWWDWYLSQIQKPLSWKSSICRISFGRGVSTSDIQMKIDYAPRKINKANFKEVGQASGGFWWWGVVSKPIELSGLDLRLRSGEDQLSPKPLLPNKACSVSGKLILADPEGIIAITYSNHKNKTFE